MYEVAPYSIQTCPCQMIGPANPSLVPRVSLCHLQVLHAMGKATLFSVSRAYNNKKEESNSVVSYDSSR